MHPAFSFSITLVEYTVIPHVASLTLTTQCLWWAMEQIPAQERITGSLRTGALRVSPNVYVSIPYVCLAGGGHGEAMAT